MPNQVSSSQAQGHRKTLLQGISSFASLNRIIYVAVTLAGFVAVGLSVRSSWFTVPVAPVDGAASAADMLELTPDCTAWFQALMAIGAISIAVSWMWKRQWTLLSTILASLLCVVPLCYPYFVMVRSPNISAEAAWLQMQHDNLLWLGGDIYNNAENGQKGWNAKIYLVDAPRQLSVVELPSWSPWEVGLHRCEDLVLWLGYSNSFCQFVRKEWSLAVLGAVLLFFSTLQLRGQLVFPRAGIALGLFTAFAVSSALIGWSLPFRASRHIQQASKLCSQHRYAESHSALERAAALLPVLGQDTHYIAQRGVLEEKLGTASEYATLRTANQLESDACYDQAYMLLEKLVESEDMAIKREALRGVLRFAIQDYNCARFQLSSERFRKVLGHQPCNVKLIYLLQLQGIREARPEMVHAMRDWMYDASGHLNFDTKKILRAAAQQHSIIGAGMTDDPDAIWAAQRKAKRP